MSADLIAVMDAAGLSSAHYLGHSTGGAIGVATALDYPGRLRSLMIYASTTHGDPYRRRIFDLRRQLHAGLGTEAYAKYTSLLLYPPYWINANHEAADEAEVQGRAPARRSGGAGEPARRDPGLRPARGASAHLDSDHDRLRGRRHSDAALFLRGVRARTFRTRKRISPSAAGMRSRAPSLTSSTRSPSTFSVEHPAHELLRTFSQPLLVAIAPVAASAQDWPTRPLRIVVPFPAGGSADVQTRVIADELSKALGQPVVIENKPGAGGNIGASEAARAQPDGYTLFMATTGTHASNVSLYAKLPYDPVKDFAPITLVTIYPQVVVPGLKYKDASFKEVVEQAEGGGRQGQFRIVRHRLADASRRRIVQARHRHARWCTSPIAGRGRR